MQVSKAARAMIRKAGNLVGVRLRPHDIRRYSASYASRAGMPIEIVSNPAIGETPPCEPFNN